MNIRRGAVDIPALVTCIFFGCTLPMAFAPWNYWVIAFISTFGLAACLRGQNSKSSFFRALLFGLGLFGVGASWVYISIHTHGNTAAPLAVVLTSLFVILLATVFALPFALFGRFNSKSTLGMLLAFPAFWVLSELLR
ncbi:MAG: apolipoprotein N-acyltransferase, partial [bacterium]